MQDFIDIYCERMAPGFWDEPVNALTNASFFIAAVAVFCLASKMKALDWRSLGLGILIAAIGTGSFLFHTLATGWAQLADVLPILFYQLFFLFIYARSVMGLKIPHTALMLGGFVLTIGLFEQLPREWLNGSLGYAPALIFLAGLGLWHARSGRKEPLLLLVSAGVFVVSLMFRTLDMSLCAAFPLGTHFLWHVLNGVVLYMTARAYILNAPPLSRP